MSHEDTSHALAEILRESTERAGDVSDDVHAAGRARMMASLEREKARRPITRQWWVIAAAAVAAIVFGIFVRSRAADLSYRVDGATADRGYVQVASAASPATVSFSDGTSVKVEASSRARVAEVTARGARVVLEDGALEVDVVHKTNARWTFEAGPYAVNVTGTEFTLRWSAKDDRLDVHMKRGSVVVEGPLASSGVAVVAGQTLDARPNEHTLSVTEENASAAPIDHEAAAVDTASTAAIDPTPAAGDLVHARATNAPPARSWSADVAGGEYARVVREAEDGGLDVALDHRPLADLAALADAARYVRRFDVAKRALEAERTRFPTTNEARAGAFMLGRVAEDSGDTTSALGSYDAYLASTPDGAFAAEALGRKLAILRAQHRPEARATGEEYLRRFPTGAYAHVARDVTSP